MGFLELCEQIKTNKQRVQARIDSAYTATVGWLKGALEPVLAIPGVKLVQKNHYWQFEIHLPDEKKWIAHIEAGSVASRSDNCGKWIPNPEERRYRVWLSPTAYPEDATIFTENSDTRGKTTREELYDSIQSWLAHRAVAGGYI